MSSTTGAVALKPAHAVTLPDGLIFISAVFFATAQLLHSPGALLDIAAALAAAAALLDWSKLARIAKVFFLLASICFVGGNLFLPHEQAELLRRALHQGVGFSCFLSLLGMLRYAVSHSITMREATAYLMEVSDRRRYQAVKVGSHALGLLFNIGVVSLIGQMIASATQGDATQVRRKAILLASMRGTVLMTIWSPLGVGFAIITQSIPTLSPTVFMLVAFLASVGLMLITTLLHTELGDPSKPAEREIGEAGGDDMPANQAQSARPLILVLSACATLFAATLGLHELLDITPLASTVIILPPFTLAWVYIERRVPLSRLGDEICGMTASMSVMRTESVIYLSASVIGAAAVALLTMSGTGLAELGNMSPLLLSAGCILAIAASAMMFIPHSIVVVFLAQLLGSATFGHEHPMILAMSLALGWAAGIALSPISAMSITMARLTSVSPSTIVLRWNGGFALTLVTSSVAAVLAATFWTRIAA
jgi:hypothetical protein